MIRRHKLLAHGLMWSLCAFIPFYIAYGSGEPSSDAEQIMNELAKHAGGEWIYEETKDDGGMFRSRSVIRPGPDGQSLIGRGWLGDEQGMFEHSSTQIWIEPGEEVVRFQNIDQDGSIARGRILMQDDGSMRWEWKSTTRSNTTVVYDVRTKFIDEDHYRFTLSRLSDAGTKEELTTIVYERAEQSPERFRTLRDGTVLASKQS